MIKRAVARPTRDAVDEGVAIKIPRSRCREDVERGLFGLPMPPSSAAKLPYHEVHRSPAEVCSVSCERRSSLPHAGSSLRMVSRDRPVNRRPAPRLITLLRVCAQKHVSSSTSKVSKARRRVGAPPRSAMRREST